MGTHTGLNYGDTHWVELWGVDTHTGLNYGGLNYGDTHWVELWGHTLG